MRKIMSLLPSTVPFQNHSATALSRSSRRDWEKQLGQVDERWIKLPEGLFSSIMAEEPVINPMYETSKGLSEQWLKRWAFSSVLCHFP
jgi:hypothetical protein